jgi:hypothetical protein
MPDPSQVAGTRFRSPRAYARRELLVALKGIREVLDSARWPWQIHSHVWVADEPGWKPGDPIYRYRLPSEYPEMSAKQWQAVRLRLQQIAQLSERAAHAARLMELQIESEGGKHAETG